LFVLGAGKSSLASVLFRLLEPLPGSLLSIDGESVLDMGLADLRGKLALVPQVRSLDTTTWMRVMMMIHITNLVNTGYLHLLMMMVVMMVGGR
jgi:ABC-type cobalamin/Fe3+-siderophores transport system ATPase subunit